MRTQTPSKHNLLPLTFHVASKHPVDDLNKVKYPGQKPEMMMYQSGYEEYFNRMPVLNDADPLLKGELALQRDIMARVSEDLAQEPFLQYGHVPATGEFNRTIIAMEKPQMIDGKLKEGAELLIARWGDGFSSPVHGHSAGFINEEIIEGMMRVNTYHITDKANKKVRPLQTVIATKGTFASAWLPALPTDMWKREKLVHNFTSIGRSITLHFVPEHTRDGRDNTFEVEYFDQFNTLTMSDVTRISREECMQSTMGDVILAKSSKVPEYGEHYIVIIGHPVKKGKDMRSHHVALPANYNTLLSKFDDKEEAVLLKLSGAMAEKFRSFHGITVNKKHVTFSEPIN